MAAFPTLTTAIATQGVAPVGPLTTADDFWPLHHWNVACSANVRGLVNREYNHRLFWNPMRHANGTLLRFIPPQCGDDVETLGMDGQRADQATHLDRRLYAQARACVLRKYAPIMRPIIRPEGTPIEILNSDVLGCVFRYLTVWDEISAGAVCRAWRVMINDCAKKDVPIEGSIEEEFPEYAVVGPQWFEALKAMPHSKTQTFGEHLEQCAEQCLAKALDPQFQDDVDELSCRASGYRLNCQGVWPKSTVKKIIKLIMNHACRTEKEGRSNGECGYYVILIKPANYEAEAIRGKLASRVSGGIESMDILEINTCFTPGKRDERLKKDYSLASFSGIALRVEYCEVTNRQDIPYGSKGILGSFTPSDAL